MSSSITHIQVTNDSTQSYVKNKVDLTVCVMTLRVKYDNVVKYRPNRDKLNRVALHTIFLSIFLSVWEPQTVSLK